MQNNETIKINCRKVPNRVLRIGRQRSEDPTEGEDFKNVSLIIGRYQLDEMSPSINAVKIIAALLDSIFDCTFGDSKRKQKQKIPRCS